MTKPFVATQEDIERWLKELGEKCNESEWADPFKLGYLIALTGVMAKMDKARRIAA
jgi:hypothetical protein